MDWLSIYGTPVYQVRGTGTITSANSGSQFDVQFELAQLLDGQIFCEIRSESDRFHEENTEFILLGENEFGYTVRVDRLLGLSTHTSFSEGVSHSLRAMVLDRASVTTPDKSVHDVLFPTTFFITNFDYFSKMHHSSEICWDIGNKALKLRPLADHKEKTQLIQASRRTAITSSVVVELTNGLEGLAESEVWVERLCWLLSLAQGCRIGWVCHESILDGRLVSRHHVSMPSLPSTGRRLIPAKEDVLDTFIDSVLPIYVEREELWQLPILIDMFVRAMMTQPFLEPAGLHLAILIDYMCGIYARQVGKERLVDEKSFKAVRKKLKDDIKEVLEEALPDIDSQFRDKMLRHIGMFQFYPFADLIREMAEYLGLTLDNQATDRFVQERNSLAHRYRFTDGRDPLEAFNEMIGFVSRFLLAILKYNGDFYDWSIPAKGNWNNRRTRLPLEKSP